MKPRTIQELSIKLNSPQNSYTLIQGFSVDTRTIKPGEVYFALPGVKVDGHTFLKDAAEKKAAGAVVSKTYSGETYGLPLIVVEDVLQALQTVAQHYIEGFKGKIVGVTGSIGKTTTKDFITTLLKEKYKVASSPGNSNSQIGIPLALLNHTTGDEDIIVLEMSMTHKGQIQKLVNIAPPDIAVITVVALVHAVNFADITGIADAKAEIFSHPKTACGIYPKEIVSEESVATTGICKKMTFSMDNPEADFFLQVTKSGMAIKTRSDTVLLPFPDLPGDHNRYNLLAAIAVARQLNLDWKYISQGIEKLKLPERRLQQEEKKGVLFINDSYNASLLSVKAALKSLPNPQPGKKKIAVLGEMLELGKYSKACHEEVGQYALEHVDQLICLGAGCEPLSDTWKAANKTPFWKVNRHDVVKELQKIAQPGDVVLLKGSRSFELWKVLEDF